VRTLEALRKVARRKNCSVGTKSSLRLRCPTSLPKDRHCWSATVGKGLAWHFPPFRGHGSRITEKAIADARNARRWHGRHGHRLLRPCQE
jgi:hypothetical protein